MEPKKEQVPLSRRVRQYYQEAQISAGCGERVQLKGVAELAPGVVSVLDSLGEVDILYDLQSWEVAAHAESPYDLFLEGIREDARQNVYEEFGLTAIAEGSWHPFYMRQRASHDIALEAAKVYLKPRDNKNTPQWHDSPISL